MNYLQVTIYMFLLRNYETLTQKQETTYKEKKKIYCEIKLKYLNYVLLCFKNF